MEFEGSIKFDINAVDGQLKKTACNAKMRRIMEKPFEFTPLKSAIQETVNWFTNNYETARR